MPNAVFTFNGFELDAKNFQLRCAGVPVPLQKIPLELLLFLVERNGQLVTRDEIVERVWGKDLFLDVESAVSTAIRKIRQALGDDPARPTYIETVPTKGYRFIPTAQRAPAPPNRMTERPTIAVLPLKDLSDDSQDYFSEGLTEEILTHLGRSHPQLGVIARTSVMRYKGTGQSVRQIGQELGAGYLLEGSVRRQAGRVRISVQLIETEGQTHLWAESYERELGEVFRLQERLGHEIASQISAHLKIDPPILSSQGSSVCREAYEAYLKGRFFWNRRTIPGAIKGIEHFEEAIRLQPDFAPAYAGLSDAYIFQGIQGIRPASDVFPKAEEAALRALALDHSLADSLCSLGSIQNLYHWNFTTAQPLFRRSIELNPSYTISRFFYAGVLSEIGHFDEALRQIEIAVELDPLSVFTLAFSGYISYRARQYERAANQMQLAIDLDPTLPTVHWYRGLVLEQFGEFETAIQAHTEAVRLSMEAPLFVAALGHAYGRAGKDEAARNVLEKLMQQSKVRYVSPLEIAVVHIGLNDLNAAFENLEKAYGQRVTRLRALRDPLFECLRLDPRYSDLLRRVGLPVEA